MAKHKYRGGRPKGVKNGESTISKGKLWTTEEEKQALWKIAHQKVEALKTDRIPRIQEGLQYKKWYVDLQPEDLDGLTNDEIFEIIYKYKGKKHLWEKGTKNGKK